MTLRLAPPAEPVATMPQHPQTPASVLPPLWGDLDPERRQQLAQQLAALIRRIQRQASNRKGDGDERA